MATVDLPGGNRHGTGVLRWGSHHDTGDHNNIDLDDHVDFDKHHNYHNDNHDDHALGQATVWGDRGPAAGL